MLRKHLLAALLVFITALLPAQTFHVSGQYLDKKQNPIDHALVGYYAQGDLLLDTTRSEQNGNFELTLDLTGIENHPSTKSSFIQLPYPNPFDGLCTFVVQVEARATILVTDMQGRQVDKHELKTPGIYQCSWGGQNRIGSRVSEGTYNVSLITGNQKTNHKVIFGGEASQRIKSDKISATDLKASGRIQDRVNFKKTNTSELDYFINPLSGDTTLGVITGNAGPDALSQIIVTVHIDSTNTWNLNNYFYNDDQSNYSTTNANFTISNDSIMTFVGSQTGVYVFDIIATDPVDPALSAQSQAQITVTNQQIFNCSGTYTDKKQQPIEGAIITYWESGNIFAAQATSSTSGFWSMDVSTSTTANDKLSFVKTNTSLLELLFNTPTADTSFGDVTGNIGPTALGDIDETHFTIDGNLSWNLNDYFANDDQSLYSFTGNSYTLSQDSLLGLDTQNTGNYFSTITATDPQDAALTAQITADVDVEYTINIPDTSIVEDFEGTILFADLNQYKNPACSQSLTYAIVSQSNSALIDLGMQGSQVVINSLQADSSGSSYVGVEITGINDTDTVYFTVNVNAMPDVRGYITDVLDTLNIGLAGVVVEMTLDGTTVYTTTTDANGFYSIQLPVATETTYYECLITQSGYTPFHTWATVAAGGGDVTEDYTIIPSTFHWTLYNEGFRPFTLSGYGPVSRQWGSPPDIIVFTDNSLVGGQNINANINTMMYNLQYILPTFNPRDAIFSNVAQEATFRPQVDGEAVIMWDNSISGSGGAAIVQVSSSNPRIVQTAALFKSYVDPVNADNKVYNQELGTCFGATGDDPNVSPNNSVFTDPTYVDTYTINDNNCADIMLDRSRIHYKNNGYTGENSYDWEIRPDLVSNYYPGGKDNGKRILTFFLFKEDGTRLSTTYDMDKVPEEIKKMFPTIFPEYLKYRVSQAQNIEEIPFVDIKLINNKAE